MNSRGLTIIAGPTASGKSAYAATLAAQTGGTVICADSLQLYKNLPILTAAPTACDRKKAPHALYGVLDAGAENSAGHYLTLLKPVLDQAAHPILVGGTGLYLQAVCAGISLFPDIPATIREKARRTDLAVIKKALPGFRFSDPQRLFRAYEVYLATGRPIESFQNDSEKVRVYDGPIRSVLIDPPRDVLEQRIRQRFHQMLAMGVLDEVAAFQGDSIAIGLFEIRAYLRKELSLQDLEEAVVIKTRQYAKRQRTWFNNRMTFDDVIR